MRSEGGDEYTAMVPEGVQENTELIARCVLPENTVDNITGSNEPLEKLRQGIQCCELRADEIQG